MKFRIVSDLHLDFEYKELSILPDEDEQVLILAGDTTANLDLFDEFLLDITYRFKQVFIIYGNHEYYGHSMETHKDALYELCTEYHNIQVLDNLAVNYEGVTIYGGTLWTNAYKDPASWLNDFNVVQYRDENGDNLYYEEHKNQLYHIVEMIKGFDVIITHHAPSYKSVSPMFENSQMNKYFVNNLDTLIIDNDDKLKLWVHGHCHNSSNYMIGNCNVLCNPKGYKNENREYNDGLIYEI